MKTTKRVIATRSTKLGPDLGNLLKQIVTGKRIVTLKTGAKLFSQGEKGTAVFFVKTGRVLLTVLSAQGMKATLATLGPRDFMGEECLVSSSRRTSTATTLKPSTVFRVDRRAMLKALHFDPQFSVAF